MNEIWKDIIGYEGLYQVSNLGRVKSVARIRRQKHNTKATVKERMLKLHICNYYQAHLSKDGVANMLNVHRLMWEAFVSSIPEGMQINHKDENKLNNFIWVNEDGTIDFEKSNLEICTHKYNMNYGTCVKRRSGKLKKPIIAFDGVHKLGTCFIGLPEASTELNISKQSISNCLCKRSCSAGGYTFDYA